MPPNRVQLANHQIVTLAVYLLGGRSQPVDTEEIAVKANELAPGRFIWRRFKDQINLELIRVYLSDAKKPVKGALLTGSGSAGWLLTPNGLSMAQKAVEQVRTPDTSDRALGVRERRWVRLEHARLIAEPAIERLASNGIESISSSEAEAVFRVDEYVRGEARKRKINRLLTTFGDDPEIGEALKTLATKVR